MKYIHDSLHGLLATHMVEGSLASQQFEGHHSKTPEVNRHVVIHAFQDLRRHVVKGAAVCLPPLIAQGRPPKITQLIDILT